MCEGCRHYMAEESWVDACYSCKHYFEFRAEAHESNWEKIIEEKDYPRGSLYEY